MLLAVREAPRLRAFALVILLSFPFLAGCTDTNPSEPTHAADASAAVTATTPSGTEPGKSVATSPPTVPPRVLQPPRATLVSASLDSSKIRLGETATLDFRIKNVGEMDGSFAVQFMLDGQVHDEKTYRLFAGATETGSFEYTPKQRGTFTLSLATSVLGDKGKTEAFSEAFDLRVILPADVRVLSANVDAREVEVGRPLTVTTELTNLGEEAGTKEVRLYVNGQVAAAKTTVVPEGETVGLSFELMQARGNYALRVEDIDLGSVFVYLPATFEILLFHATTDRPQLGDTFGFGAEVRNVGDKGGTATGAITFAGRQVLSIAQYIGPQASARIETPTNLVVNFVEPTPARIAIGSEAKEATVSPLRPQIAFTQVTTPTNSDWACPDEATTSISLVNNGDGRDLNLALEFWVDGELVNANGGKEIVVGTLVPGQVFTRQVTLAPVVDYCGADDEHVLVVKVIKGYGGVVSSGAIPFVV